MKVSPKQRKAVEFVANNPGATPAQVVEAAGISQWGSNAPEFIWRLINSGVLQLDLTPAAREELGLD